MFSCYVCGQGSPVRVRRSWQPVGGYGPIRSYPTHVQTPDGRIRGHITSVGDGVRGGSIQVRF